MGIATRTRVRCPFCDELVTEYDSESDREREAARRAVHEHQKRHVDEMVDP